MPAAWIETITPARARGKLARLYDAILKRAGRVSNIYIVESLNPAGLEAHVSLYRALMFREAPLSRVEREAVALVVSATNGCRY